MALTTAQIQQAYVTFFNRPADNAGLTYWSSYKGSDADLYNTFAVSGEYLNLFAGQNSTATVNTIYTNLLGRAPEPAGLAYWVQQLDNGALKIGNIALAIGAGAQGADKTTVTNKVSAATTFTTALDTTAEITGYASPSASSLASVKTWLGGVTTDATLTSQTSATNLTAITTTVSTGAAASGSTFTLTTGADIIAGTDKNDVINGSGTVESTGGTFSATTFNTADQIDAVAGTDTLNLTIDGALKANTVTAINAATIKNVETLNLRNVAGTTGGTQAVSADASLIPGLTAFNSDRSTNTVTVTNLASGASAGVIGDGTVTNGAFNAGYVAAATAATLNIQSGVKAGAVTLSGTGLTSTTVNSTGAANTIGALTLAATTTTLVIDAATKLTTGAVANSTAAAVTTVTVKGVGAVDLSTTALETAVTKIDASANTGGLTVKVSDKVTLVVTGSEGNDVITTNAVLTTGSMNGGAGTDTLDIGANVTHANTASLAAKFTNFETLRVNGTFDASLIAGITAIDIADANANSSITKMTAAQAAAVTLRNTNTNDLALALADSTGTADVVSITTGIGGTTTAAATNLGALTINGFETLNVKVAPGSTATVGANKTTTIGSFVADKLTAINLTGNAVTLTNAATTKAVTIDASALTGDGAATALGLTISGNLVAGSTVTGSAVKDTFNLGTVGSTYNGGDGADAFAGSVAQINAAAVYNVINGGAGTDTLTITGGAAVTMVDDNFKNISNVEKIVQSTTGNNALSVTTGGWFDAGFKAAGVDYTATVGTEAASVDMNTFTGKATISLTSGGTTHAQTVRTGSGDDSVTVATASTTSGVVTVATGAGVDTISITDGTAATAAGVVLVTAGTGADVVTLAVTRAASALSAVTYTVAAGDSTVTAYDKVTGLAASDTTYRSDYVDFAGTGTVAANVAGGSITGYTGAELTYSVATGILTFAGSKATTLTLAQKLAAIDLAVTVDTATLLYVDTASGSSFLYNENTAGNSVVELVGVTTITSLVAGNTVTANAFSIS